MLFITVVLTSEMSIGDASQSGLGAIRGVESVNTWVMNATPTDISSDAL